MIFFKIIQFFKNLFSFSKKENKWEPDKLIIEDWLDKLTKHETEVWYYRNSPVEYIIIHTGTEKFEKIAKRNIELGFPGIHFHYGVAPCGKVVHMVNDKKYVNHSVGYDTKSISVRLDQDNYPKKSKMLLTHLKNKYPEAEVLSEGEYDEQNFHPTIRR